MRRCMSRLKVYRHSLEKRIHPFPIYPPVLKLSEQNICLILIGNHRELFLSLLLFFSFLVLLIASVASSIFHTQLRLLLFHIRSIRVLPVRIYLVLVNSLPSPSTINNYPFQMITEEYDDCPHREVFTKEKRKRRVFIESYVMDMPDEECEDDQRRQKMKEKKKESIRLKKEAGQEIKKKRKKEGPPIRQQWSFYDREKRAHVLTLKKDVHSKVGIFP